MFESSAGESPDALTSWLAETLDGVDALSVLAFAADRLRAEAADGRRSSGDDVIALTEAIEVAQAAQVLALGRFDAARTWADGTARCAATWIHRATDAPRTQLARLVAAGRVTHAHQPFADALATGATSVGHIAAVGRVARKERAAILERDAQVLATIATDTPLEPFERAVTHWAGWADDEISDTDSTRADAKRSLTLARTFGGWHLKGFLPTEDGELLRKLLDHLIDPPDRLDHPCRRTPAQRRADALGTLLRRHAQRRTTPIADDTTQDDTDTDVDDTNTGTNPDAGTDDAHDTSPDHGDSCCAESHGDHPPPDNTAAPPGTSPPGTSPPDSPPPGTSSPGGPLVTIDVRVDLVHLLTAIDDDHRPADQPIDERLLRAAATLPDLVPWSRGELRRLLCDSWIGPILVNGASLPLDLGRRTRTFTASQRRAIAMAHPTCILCDAPVDDCVMHHMEEWDADDGPTDLANGIPLCPPDHRMLHLARLRLHRCADLTVTVTDRWGRVVGRSVAA